jgi:hypothetical protein
MRRALAALVAAGSLTAIAPASALATIKPTVKPTVKPWWCHHAAPAQAATDSGEDQGS